MSKKLIKKRITSFNIAIASIICVSIICMVLSIVIGFKSECVAQTNINESHLPSTNEKLQHTRNDSEKDIQKKSCESSLDLTGHYIQSGRASVVFTKKIQVSDSFNFGKGACFLSKTAKTTALSMNGTSQHRGTSDLLIGGQGVKGLPPTPDSSKLERSAVASIYRPLLDEQEYNVKGSIGKPNPKYIKSPVETSSESSELGAPAMNDVDSSVTKQHQNSSKTLEISVFNLPDIQCSYFWWKSVTVTEGDAFWVKGKVNNAGSDSAGPSHVKMYLSTDNDWDVSDDYYLGKKSVDSLAPGAYETPQWDFNFPDIRSGSYSVWLVAVVDCDNEVTESDENNTWKCNSSFTAEDGTPNIYIYPTSLDIYQSGSSHQPLYYLVPDSNSKDSFLKSNDEHPMGHIIPTDVKKYWSVNRPQLQYNLKELRASIDWSTNDSPVKNQGSCGSCWAFSTVGLVENLSSTSDLSEQTVVSCTPPNGSISNDCSGGWHGDALEYIHNDGIPNEGCYPYIAQNGNCSDRCNDPSILVKVNQYDRYGRWGEATSSTINNLKALLQSGPVLVHMDVPDDNTFNGNPGYTGGIYNYDGGMIPSGRGHSVLVVGYNDDQQYFKAKNSWGTNWGENGYFRISYDDVTDDVHFGGYACTASGITIEGGENEFTISNVGTVTLDVTNISSNKSWLTFNPSTPPTLNIPASGSEAIQCNINWSLVPNPSDQATVTINSNDPDENPVYVSVTAYPIQPPPAPTLTSPSNGATNQPTTITLIWNTSSGATSYRLQVDNDANFGSPIYDQSGLITTSQQVSGLSNGTTYYWRVNASNASGTSSWSSEWHFTTVYNVGLMHFTYVVDPTGRTQPVYIADATLDGVQLQSDDEVGVFDGTLLVGAGKIVNLPMGDPIIVYLEYTPPGGDPLPGAHDGNDMLFRVWDQSTDREECANISEVVSGTPVFAEGAIVTVKLEAPCIITQETSIQPNKLNLISFHVSPDEPDAASVFDPLPNFIIAQDDNGNVRVPPNVVFPGHPGTNTIGNVDVTKGYSVYISGDNQQILQVSGIPIDLNNNPISLVPNKLNKIAFLSQNTIPIVNVFSSTANQHVYDYLVMVSDDNGNYYIPPNVVFPGHPGTNTIGYMQLGKGYNLYHTSPSTLNFNYPEGGTPSRLAKTKSKEPIANVEHFSFLKTGESRPVFLRNSGLELEPGDELAIFADDHCVGAMKYYSNLDDPLVIWQALPDYDLVGIKDGDKLFVRHWSSRAQIIKDVCIDGEVQFDSDRLFSLLNINSQTKSEVVRQHVGVIPDKMALLQNYPNPFNPSTAIEFNISTPSKVSLVIYNIQGEVVVTLADGFLSPGVYTINWDGGTDDGLSVPGGVYLYKLKAGSFEAVRKMIYIK